MAEPLSKGYKISLFFLLQKETLLDLLFSSTFPSVPIEYCRNKLFEFRNFNIFDRLWKTPGDEAVELDLWINKVRINESLHWSTFLCFSLLSFLAAILHFLFILSVLVQLLAKSKSKCRWKTQHNVSADRCWTQI